MTRWVTPCLPDKFLRAQFLLFLGTELAVTIGNTRSAAAVESVRQWKYIPARLHDKPVDVEINVVVNFGVSLL